MKNQPRILGVIPARGGSKGIPKKNIIDLCGKPLIFYTIKNALKSKMLTEFVVSTDDNEISEISKKYGARVIQRPKDISSDNSPTEECLIHALNCLSKKREEYDYVVILEPTSPFRKASTIDKAINETIIQNAESLLTVIKTKANIGSIDQNMFFKQIRKDKARRRQDRSDLFIESSTLYVVSGIFLKTKKSIVSDKWLALEISKDEAIDINTYLDLDYARFRMQNNK